jgi:hypothetical protein
VERRYAAGMTLSAFYTYSKTLDENDGDGAASGITYYNRNLEKGRAAVCALGRAGLGGCGRRLFRRALQAFIANGNLLGSCLSRFG